VAARADGVAAGSGDFAFGEAGFEHHHGFFETTTDDLCQARDDFTVGALLRALEEQRPTLDAGVLVLHCASGQ